MLIFAGALPDENQQPGTGQSGAAALKLPTPPEDFYAHLMPALKVRESPFIGTALYKRNFSCMPLELVAVRACPVGALHITVQKRHKSNRLQLYLLFKPLSSCYR